MLISKDDCFYLGYISKAKGFGGNLVLFLDVDEPENYAKLERVLVDLNGTLTPFFTESVRLQEKNFVLVKFEGIDDRDGAVNLSGRELYLPLSELPELPADEYYLHDLEGMEVTDATAGFLGTVDAVLDYSNNPLIRLFREGDEVLIPLGPDFVKKVDKVARVIHVDLPEGLLEINKS